MQATLSLVYYAIGIAFLFSGVNAAPQQSQPSGGCAADRSVYLCCGAKDAKDGEGNPINPIPLIKDLNAVVPSISVCLNGGCNDNTYEMCCEKSEMFIAGPNNNVIPGLYTGKNCKPLRQS